MLKAIIVDDEQYIRKGMRIMIDWEKEGISIAGEASNGKQAISLVKEYGPDIVLVDIKMPVMDGLAFIEHIRKDMGLATKVIIFSGYADFKYAQKAIQYNVSKYILKPIAENELIEALRDVKKEIEDEKKLEYKSQVSFQSRKSNLIKGALLGKNSIWTDGSDETLLNVKKSSEYFCVLFHMNNKWYPANKAINNGEIDADSDMEIFTRIINDKGLADFIDLFEFNNLWGFFVDRRQMAGKGFTTSKFLYLLHDSVKVEYSNYVQLFAGKITDDFPNDIKGAFDTASETMKLSFYYYSKAVYQYSDLEETPIDTCYNEEIFTDDILDAIVYANTIEVKEKVEAIFKYLKEKRLDPEVIKIRLNYLVHKIVDTISGIDGSYDRNLEKYLIYNVDYREVNIEELRDMVQAFCTNAALYIQDLKGNLSGGIAYKVKMYVDAHFADDITLTKLAQHFYVNTVYLGQVFKKVYNMKFNDYLNNTRIEEAKKLLKLTGLKAYEISHKVGYNKPEYFSKKFEEVTGLSPSAYREAEQSK